MMCALSSWDQRGSLPGLGHMAHLPLSRSNQFGWRAGQVQRADVTGASAVDEAAVLEDESVACTLCQRRQLPGIATRIQGRVGVTERSWEALGEAVA